MGRIENLTISFLKPNLIYLAGEGIHGSINFRLNDETLINSIKLRALGKAVVHWYFLNQYSTLIFINNCDQGRN